jgi:hypothetical protein
MRWEYLALIVTICILFGWGINNILTPDFTDRIDNVEKSVDRTYTAINAAKAALQSCYDQQKDCLHYADSLENVIDSLEATDE